MGRFYLYKSRWILTAARFLTLLGLALWLGGLAFLGRVAAPVLSDINSALVPLAVGAMMERFTPLLYVCGALMLAGWAAERLRRGEIHPGNARLWWAQGACCGAMLLLALYLGGVLLPQLRAAQNLSRGTTTMTMVRTPATAPSASRSRTAAPLTSAAPARTAAARTAPARPAAAMSPGRPLTGAAKARFDAAHNLYTQLAKLTTYLGLAALLLLCLRLSSSAKWDEHAYAADSSVAAEDDIFVKASLRS